MAAHGKGEFGGSEDTVLSDDVIARLRAEEEIREEVRRKSRGKFSWLNQPIAIWVLSSVVLGTISFAYSKVNENAQKELRNYEQATVVRREISFRVKQVEKLISNHDDADRAVDQLNDTDLSRIIADGTLSDSGSMVQRYFTTAVALAVVAQLGGIGALPVTAENSTVWIGGSGYGNSALPSRRGYQREEFKNLSLEDLWIEYHLLMSNKNKLETEQTRVREAIAAFDKAVEPSDVVSKIPGIATNALTMREWSTESDTEAIKTTIDEVRRWATGVRNAWSDLSTIMTAVTESTN